MPVYEYECQACKEVIEVWQSLSEAPAEKCPACGGGLKKIISMSSFQLKGGGWFADGYGNSSSATSESSSSAPSCPKADGKPCNGSC